MQLPNYSRLLLESNMVVYKLVWRQNENEVSGAIPVECLPAGGREAAKGISEQAVLPVVEGPIRSRCWTRREANPPLYTETTKAPLRPPRAKTPRRISPPWGEIPGLPMQIHRTARRRPQSPSPAASDPQSLAGRNERTLSIFRRPAMPSPPCRKPPALAVDRSLTQDTGIAGSAR